MYFKSANTGFEPSLDTLSTGSCRWGSLKWSCKEGKLVEMNIGSENIRKMDRKDAKEPVVFSVHSESVVGTKQS